MLCGAACLGVLHNPHAKNLGKRAHYLSSNEKSNDLSLSVTTVMMSYNGPLLSQDEPLRYHAICVGGHTVKRGRIYSSLAGLRWIGQVNCKPLSYFGSTITRDHHQTDNFVRTRDRLEYYGLWHETKNHTSLQIPRDVTPCMWPRPRTNSDQHSFITAGSFALTK